MAGIVFGKRSGTFKIYEASPLSVRYGTFEEGNCMTIMLDNRTVDIATISTEILADVWVGISHLIYSRQKTKT
jgi:hypothetical protein